MELVENGGTILEAPKEYHLAYCIGADFKPPKQGIIHKLVKTYDMDWILKVTYPKYYVRYITFHVEGDCLQKGRVFNLITRESRRYNTTKESFERAVKKMKGQALLCGIDKIALTRSGITGLKREEITEIITETFENTDIKIMLCD